jgi:hypothetical protein
MKLLPALLLLCSFTANASLLKKNTNKWVLHPTPGAKKLADDLVIQNDGLSDVIFHVTPPHEHANYA